MSMTINLDLEGRHALVCGASKGIGEATAVILASMGAKVTALARHEDGLTSLMNKIQESSSVKPDFLLADLDDHASLFPKIEAYLKEEGPVHILINNTGGPSSGPLLSASPEQFTNAFSRHVLSAQGLVTRLLPGMIESQYGRIINVLSTSVREPIDNLGVSNTIRAAMAAWAKTLSRELPPGVTINSVLPGFTDTARLGELAQAVGNRTGRTCDEVYSAWTAMVPEGRLAQPEELGQVIAFLASPAASYVRGVCLPVDGGRLRSI